MTNKLGILCAVTLLAVLADVALRPVSVRASGMSRVQRMDSPGYVHGGELVALSCVQENGETVCYVGTR